MLAVHEANMSATVAQTALIGFRGLGYAAIVRTDQAPENRFLTAASGF